MTIQDTVNNITVQDTLNFFDLILFLCVADMKFRGNCVDNIKSEIHFEDLWVQAFQLKNGKPSSSKRTTVCVCVFIPPPPPPSIH